MSSCGIDGALGYSRATWYLGTCRHGGWATAAVPEYWNSMKAYGAPPCGGHPSKGISGKKEKGNREGRGAGETGREWGKMYARVHGLSCK